MYKSFYCEGCKRIDDYPDVKGAFCRVCGSDKLIIQGKAKSFGSFGNKSKGYASKLYSDRSALKDYRKEIHRVKEFCIFGIWCLMEEVASKWLVCCFFPDGIAHLKGNESPKKTIAMVRNWILDQQWTVSN